MKKGYFILLILVLTVFSFALGRTILLPQHKVETVEAIQVPVIIEPDGSILCGYCSNCGEGHLLWDYYHPDEIDFDHNHEHDEHANCDH